MPAEEEEGDNPYTDMGDRERIAYAKNLVKKIALESSCECPCKMCSNIEELKKVMGVE